MTRRLTKRKLMKFEGKTTPENEIPDWEEDISSHLKLKISVLGNTVEKFEYFNSLSRDFVVPNPNGEPDWVQFLGEIYGFVKGQFLESQHINREEDDGEENGHYVNNTGKDDSKDPQYKIFFENFRPHGTSYVLEIDDDNAFVRYDARNNESNNGKNTDCSDKHISLETNVFSEANKHAPEDLDAGEKHVSFETNASSEAEKHAPEDVGMAVDFGEEHVSFETSVSSRAGKHAVAVYFAEEHVSLGKNVSSEAERHLPKNVGMAVVVGEKHVSSETNMSLEAEKHAPENVGLAVDVGEKHVSSENNVGSEALKHFSENEPINVQVRRRGRPKRVSETIVAGTSTKRVNVDLRNQNRREVPSVNSDTDIKEEVDEDDPPNRKNSAANPVLNVDKWLLSHSVNKKKKREFREKLVEILQKPYCEEEYGTLYQTICQRKPVQCIRVLRNQTKTYEDKRAGKSFLDHYTDLAESIDSVRCDRPRVLNLLRGFFYWMMNLSHEGVFKPWKDSTCLEVLPATK